MKTRVAFLCMLGLLGVGVLPAQDYVGTRDFLSDHEVDLIREAQDPNQRIAQYLHFARLRLELVQQRLATEEAGRSVDIHRNLGEYAKIIDAIDLVVEDALVRDVNIDESIQVLTTTEGEFVALLQNIADNPAKDHWRYEFVLADAIDITNDSMELAKEDQAERKREITEADLRDKKKREASMTPERRTDVTKAKKQEEAKEAEQKRKRPTLRKPEEKSEKDR